MTRLAVEDARRLAARAMLEDELLETIRQAASLWGYRFYHTHDSRRSPAGFPDLVIAGHGRVLYLELKREGKQLEPDQVAWQQVLVAAGQDHRVIRPSDLDALLRDLDPQFRTVK